MKLLRVGPKGQEKPAMLDQDGVLRDLSSLIQDIDPTTLSDRSFDQIRAHDPDQLPRLDPDQRIGACVGGIGKVVCVGLNYSDHALETGNPIPSEPVLFAKAVSCVCGPNDDVLKPRGSTKLDWEVELAIVIGTEARYVSEENAMNHVAGFAVFNDVSERHFQAERGGQWMKGKSHDTFGPLGPWLVTRDEVADPGRLAMELKVNGDVRQKGSTETLIFSVPHVVSYISQFMSLQPGDIIPTGTPPGVGMGMKPPVFLELGDVMELEIEGLGRQRQKVIAA
ncbi:MAG TPA: fumarylacetoacetate hydrolase family protein [Paracoccaceae bacterium]|nr:fumarylacetoacetate hydrolase family protein [Paracoccaceae bacterium]